MDYKLELKNNSGEIVGYSKVDKEDYDKFSIGFWHLSHGYASGKFGKLKGKLHRFIMNAEKGDLHVDHINHDRLDNRKNNLRFVTVAQNSQNKSKTVNATSRYYGVSKIKNTDKWVCSIYNDGKHITRRYEIEEHAAYCYDTLAITYYGPGAQINGLEKPEDFEMSVKMSIHKGVYKTKGGKYNVIIWYNKKTKSLGTFETVEEVIDVYNRKFQEIENSKEEKPLPEIKRNQYNQVIIETFNKKNEKMFEFVVDEYKYYELNRYKWHESNGYIKTHMNNTTVMIHRYLMNPNIGEIVDHINNNPLDNRIANLRICNASLNSHNRKIKEGEFRGVSKTGKNFRSLIIKDGVQYHIGTYTTEEDAARAYDKKARELYGNNASTNYGDIEDIEEILTSYEKTKSTTTSKYRGVSITESGKYQVHVARKYIGVFNTQKEAAFAYDKKALELLGDKAKLNFS